MNYGIVTRNSKQVLQWTKEGLSAYRIAKNLGCSKCSVLRFLKSRGTTTKHKCKVDYNNLLKDREDEVIELYNGGKTCEEIGKITGHSQSRVSILLKNSGKQIRDYRYYVNEHFFDSIDSEKTAYVLGWFYSDGCVDNNGKLRIQIQKEDEDILYQIKDLMEYEGPLYEIPPPKKYPHRKHQVTLTINRKALANRLIQLGCTPHKSLILTFPDFSVVPEIYLPHFIRGVFDGDGSIVVKDDKYLNVSITSCESFIQPLRDYLRIKLEIDTKHYYRYEHTNTLQMMITHTKYAKKFLNWMYQDANFYLTRKFTKYQEYLEKGV